MSGSSTGFHISFEHVFLNEESEEESVDSEEEINRLSDENSDAEYTESDTYENEKRQQNEDLHFSWNDDTFVPKTHKFQERCGINRENFHPNKTTTEADFFLKVMSEDLVSAIVDETNKYAAQYLSANPTLPKRSVMCTWTDTTVGEFYLFIALTMLMVRNKKLKLSEYWSKDWLLRSEQFPKMMARDRYVSLLRMLHFCDNTKQPKGDRQYKIREIKNMFLNNFKSLLNPFENLCIKENLVPFKGRHESKQYIISNRRCFGKKLVVLCDVKTGFVLDATVYNRNETDINIDPELGFSGSLVMKMLEPYLDKGHSVYTSNRFTSPALSNELHLRKTNSCGAVKAQRKYMPNFEHIKIPNGSKEMRATENMMVLRWHENREVLMLTTMHHDEMKETSKLHPETNEPFIKPACVTSYNSCMGSVGSCDLFSSSVEFGSVVRKNTKWYKKLFFHFVHISLLNACALYKLHVKKKIPIATFQLEVIRQILEQYSGAQVRKPIGRASNQDNMPTRLTRRHFPSQIAATQTCRNPLRRCRVCGQTMKKNKRTRRRTRYVCSKCDVPLCIVPCFEIYHTVKNF